MRVGIIGINHKLGSLNIREKLAQACQRSFVTGCATHDDHTFILLTTCNRTEIYFASEDPSLAQSYLLQVLRNEIDDEFDQKVYTFFGLDCFIHLARVTAGLDSAIIAETEIQGQVKAAYENAANSISLPSELHYLFQKSLRIGKQVRADLLMHRGMPDIEHAIYQTGMHFFSSMQEAKILFVGASDVNCKILAFLKAKNLQNITLCNRSQPRAERAATAYGLQVLQWNGLSNWHNFNWIIFGTKSPHHLIGSSDFPKHCIGHKLIIDLSVPRNVEPKLGRDQRITLLNIDQIDRILKVRKQQISQTLVEAEQMANSAARHYVEAFSQKVTFALAAS